MLKRACDSVRAMAASNDYSIIVVANGSKVSSNVLDWLATRPEVQLIRLRSGSYPLARRVGAEMADCEFLAFLDDDDELMPDTLAPKIAYFRKYPDVDVLVTNGLRVSGSTESKIFPPSEARSADFVETMMRSGWGACSMTLRTQRIDLSPFDPKFRHLEWTLTALELARHHKFGFLDEPTYRYHQDTPDSLSKSNEHTLASPELWQRLVKSYVGTPYAAAMLRRYGTECRNGSWECVRQGKICEAWRLYIRSLRSPGGINFLSFAARLVFASLRRLFA